MAIRFCSDPHMDNFNVRVYDKRAYPDGREFIDGYEMTEYIIEQWNKVVSPDDTVYVLGDFLFINGRKTIDRRNEVLKRLNGHICLIMGNHDGKESALHQEKCFAEVRDYKKLVLPNGTNVILSHYPMMSWDKMFRGAYHLYGHVHSYSEDAYQVEMYKNERKLKEFPGEALRMFNVCISLPWMGYAPRTLEEIISGYEKYGSEYREKLEETHEAYMMKAE